MIEKIIEAVVEHEKSVEDTLMRKFFPNFDPFVNRDGTVWLDMDYGLELKRDVSSEDLFDFVTALEQVVDMLKPVAAKQAGKEVVTRYINILEDDDGERVYHDHSSLQEARAFNEENWYPAKVLSRGHKVTLKV